MTIQRIRELEQSLAASVFQFGQAMHSSEDFAAMQQTHQAMHHYLDELIALAHFATVIARFQLDAHSAKLLALAYIFTIEPDALAPYLKSNWYEQGPNISIAHAVSIIAAAPRSDANEQPSEPSDIYRLADCAHSPLFRWGFFVCEHERHFSVSPISIDTAVLSVLSITNSPNTVLFHNNNEPFQGAWSVVKAEMNLAHRQCYAHLLDKEYTGMWQLNCDDVNERLPLVRSLGASQEIENCFILDLNQLPHENELRMHLRNLVLSSQYSLVYWPKALYFCQRNAALAQMLQHWLQLKAGVLITDNPCLHQREDEPETIVSHFDAIPEIRFPRLNTKQRASVWLRVSTEFKRQLTPLDAQWLAQLYPFPPSRIVQIGQDVIRECGAMPLDSNALCKQLQRACIAEYSAKHPTLATLSQPKANWDDMILTSTIQTQIEELVHRIRYRVLLSEEVRGLRPGVQALFWGKPGTGKSMAAEAIAAELMLPLYKVNLANIASKWIGESEKHLAKLFDQAEQQHAILLFDEADAIFAKRSEVNSSHDKNANMGVSFLLQRMENYNGVLLLSTNFKNNLDEAFLRRFHSVIEFAMPNVEAREALWQKAWQGRYQLAQSISLPLLAESFEFSPAQIANIAELCVLYCICEDAPQIGEAILTKAIMRELDKHSAGYLAAQKVNQWRQRQNHALTIGE
ncbi:ATP-binding protein [Alteromonas sp. a30]|uniref:ATP-binding protein n=1 Tax=Alteromonas sp. a30 TaxID=2730917 RepID=UPI00227EFAC3|nr:ATP-binding protein [Alteromonas sp. a30]MCY7296494.1 ATP-binding protein [Alteromonas sp. a30]